MACDVSHLGIIFWFQSRENTAGEVSSGFTGDARPDIGSGESLQPEENLSVEEEDHRERRWHTENLLKLIIVLRVSRNQQTLSVEDIANKIRECESSFDGQAHAEPHFNGDILPDEWLCNSSWVANDGVPMAPDQAMTTFTCGCHIGVNCPHPCVCPAHCLFCRRLIKLM